MLVCIKNLVDKVSPSIKVDIRSRNSDGSLKYENQQTGDVTRYIRKLISVTLKTHGSLNFVHWKWEPTGTLDDISCHYSGVSIELADEYYLEVIE